MMLFGHTFSFNCHFTCILFQKSPRPHMQTDFKSLIAFIDIFVYKIVFISEKGHGMVKLS